MSILDELLVAIDDQTELKLDQIRALFPQYTYQTLSAALGRLRGWNWVEQVNGRDTTYRVTVNGSVYIDSTLKAVRNYESSWDQSWFCAAVRLPESGRKLRDRLRHYFVDHGYGRFIDSLWISPWNRQDELVPLIREFNAGANVFLFQTQPLGQATNQIIINEAWEWPEITDRFTAFLNDFRLRAQGLISAAAEANTPEVRQHIRRLAKNMVFEYAQALKSGPNLPTEFSPIRELEKQAWLEYEKIRPYCYR